MKTLLLALALTFGVLAQAQTSDSTTYAPSHLAAAAELLEVSRAKETTEESMAVMIDAQLAQAPQLAQFEDVMREFFAKYMSWEALRDDMARLQASAYTEEELRELVAWYQTPLGQKVAAVTPQLTAQGAAIGQRVAAEHMPELQGAIMDRAQELMEEQQEQEGDPAMPDPTGN